MPCGWRRPGFRSWRACPPRSPMTTTAVVRVMTPTHRVKGPARRRLPRSFEARSPQGTGPFVFSFNPTPRRGRPDAAASAQRPLFHNLHRVQRWLLDRQCAQTPAGAEARPRWPAPSRVCPRTSTGRFGVHVRSGGRLSRAAMQPWLAQASRVACGHSRDGRCPVGLPVRSSALQAEEAGSTPARGTTSPINPKPFVELTLRRAQTGRNDWAASEPVTDNLFISSVRA